MSAQNCRVEVPELPRKCFLRELSPHFVPGFVSSGLQVGKSLESQSLLNRQLSRLSGCFQVPLGEAEALV